MKICLASLGINFYGLPNYKTGTNNDNIFHDVLSYECKSIGYCFKRELREKKQWSKSTCHVNEKNYKGKFLFETYDHKHSY